VLVLELELELELELRLLVGSNEKVVGSEGVSTVVDGYSFFEIDIGCWWGYSTALPAVF
jgi:hypothetical protein